ncbi:MAG: twin-arginine translocase subunit TatC [Chloroflexota bacterium]
MTLLEHLEELRRRIIVVVVCILAAAAAGFVFSADVLDLLTAPLPDDVRLGYLSPAGPFAAQLKIAGFLGIGIAMPIILYNIWRFVTPGLTKRERGLVWPMIVGALVLFVVGLAIGYLLVPYALNFLLSFGENLDLEEQLTIDEYIGFVTTMLLAFGIIFEFPIVLLALARVHILNYRFLASRRRYAVLIIVLIAIVATPGGDPISPLLLSGVMYVLFELTLFLIRLMRR